MNEKENESEGEYGEYDALVKHLGRPSNEALIDQGRNQISVGDDDPLLKRLIAKHGDRRYSKGE